MAFKITVKGLDELARKTDAIAKQAQIDIDKQTEASAMKIVNNARANAPVRDNILRPSIDILDESLMSRSVGSPVEYARRQEYEHPTRKGFLRKAFWDERDAYRNKCREILGKLGD